MKTCPYCKGNKVIMFDADNDLCQDCGKWFPAVEDVKSPTTADASVLKALQELVYLKSIKGIEEHKDEYEKRKPIAWANAKTALAQYSTQPLPKTELVNLTDEDALEIWEISGGGPSISSEAKVSQIKDILTTNKFYNTSTNIPPIVWAKIFDFLIRRGYMLPKGLLNQSLPESQESKEAEDKNDMGVYENYQRATTIPEGKEDENQETIFQTIMGLISHRKEEGLSYNEMLSSLTSKYHITKKP